MTRLVGKVVRKDAEIIIIYRVGEKYYASTDHNKELFETYLHTGDESYLDRLEGEVEL